MILPKNNHFTTLLIRHMHKYLLHAGTQSVLYHIKQRYWIINGREVVQRQLTNCVECRRFNPKIVAPQMGNLPTARIVESRAFTHTGVDYAGPIAIKLNKLRSTTTAKSYIALFVCYATKAIHLELVTELTTQAYLAAFRRFISRRGICQHMYSDCGTNFMGASRQIPELIEVAKMGQSSEVQQELTNLRVQWHFNPPQAPHFGGLWEAGVKSTKYHLHRILKNSTLTFEETYTLLTQIDACLNSRPISEMTADINDLEPLTPGHFLIGGSLKTLPEKDLSEIPKWKLSRWEYIQQLLQDFWKQWRREFFGRLQQRSKWQSGQCEIKEGDLVLVLDDQRPPSMWLMARVEKVHPGQDKITRVATIKTQHGTFTRPVIKLCQLPIGATEEN